MAKQIGADRFGDFYTDGKVRKRREWRCVSDTLYDYGRWLGILMTLGKFIVKPRNIKAMFRYRSATLSRTSSSRTSPSCSTASSAATGA